MPQTHVVPTGKPVIMFGKKAQFPRAGAWSIHDGRLGIAFEVTDTSVNMHYLKDDGTTELHFDEEKERLTGNNIVPKDSVRLATYAEIHAGQPKRTEELTPFSAAVMGYAVDDAAIASMTVLERKTLGLPLTAEEETQAQIEETKLQLDLLNRQKIAQHPEAIALEEQIEIERQAFIASVEQRRTALVAKLSTP